MIINDKDASARLNSPLNLINKLHEKKINGNAMDLFTGNNGKTAEKPKSFLQTPAIKPQQEIAKQFNPFEKKTATPQSQQLPASPSNSSALIPSSSFPSEPNLDGLL